MLKAIAQFFDYSRFVQEKELAVKETRPLRDANTGLVIGTRVEVLIWKDDTEYAPNKDGSIPTNRYNTFTVKVHKKDLGLEVDDIVEFKGVVAKIYGEYNNELSVEADDVVVVRKGLFPENKAAQNEKTTAEQKSAKLGDKA